MPSVEERLAYLEGRLGDHATAFDGLRGDFAAMRSEVGRVDAKVDRVDAKVDRVDAKVDRVDAKVDRLDSKIDRLFFEVESRMSRQFVWLVGIQVTVLLAIVGTLLNSLYR
jgi:archaellum component FlaC